MHWVVGEYCTEKVAFESLWEGSTYGVSILRTSVLERIVVLSAAVVKGHLRQTVNPGNLIF